MRICAVTTWPPHREGVALYSSYLYTHMSKMARVDVIANTSLFHASFGNLYPKRHEHGGVRIVRCWCRGNPVYPLKIFRQVLKLKPDVIHVQHGWLLYGGVFSSLLFPVLLLLLRLVGKPYVVTMHTVVRKEACLYKSKLINSLAKAVITIITKAIVKLSSAVIVHNCMIKETLERAYSLEKDGWKIIVIPHGAKEASEKNICLRTDESLHILSLGFVRRRKGIEYLIEAFKKFLVKYPRGTFIVTGGKHAHEKKNPIEEIKWRLPADISEKVVFTNFIDDENLDELIWKSDIIVLYSVEDSFVEASGALARVALFGRPVICSRVPKFWAELRDGQNCVMVEPGDPESLVKALILLANDADLRRRLGENLKNKFKNREWSMVAEQHINLFEKLLENKEL